MVPELFVNNKARYLLGVIAFIFTLSACSGLSSQDTVRVDNPFIQAPKWYVDRGWAEKAIESGGSAIAHFNTGVWLENLDDIPEGNGKPFNGIGLRDHLDAALAQGANLIQLVLYSLPGRNCSAPMSLGDLELSDAGMHAYKRQYIDNISRIIGDKKYKSLRIVVVLEPDSLSNLVAYADLSDCKDAENKSWGYVEGIRYALAEFKKINNVYTYLDIAQANVLGRSDLFESAIQFYLTVITGRNANAQMPAPGWDALAGFISNVANYIPLQEPFLSGDIEIGGQPVSSALFLRNNSVLGELDYGGRWRKAMIAAGAPERIGMLVDTSRNGWGGPNRPTQLASGSDLDSVVNASRIDRRPHRMSFCNQPGGIGERPRSNPIPGFHAFLWTKPPGQSDDYYQHSFDIDPSLPNFYSVEMCDPQGRNYFAENDPATAGKGIATGAMAFPPFHRRWFDANFRMLLENAYPPL